MTYGQPRLMVPTRQRATFSICGSGKAQTDKHRDDEPSFYGWTSDFLSIVVTYLNGIDGTIEV